MPFAISGTADHSYFVVMIDYGRRGLEAVVDPEITYRGVVDRVASGEYKNIAFIHACEAGVVSDITDEVMKAARRSGAIAMADHVEAFGLTEGDLR